MATTIFVAIWSFIVGMGLTYIMLAGIIQAERRRREIYPAIRNEQPPIPICHPDRHNQLTGAYQEQMDERDAHEYRQEIRRLRDELAELRFPVATTPSRYNVIDRFAYLEVQQ